MPPWTLTCGTTSFKLPTVRCATIWKGEKFMALRLCFVFFYLPHWHKTRKTKLNALCSSFLNTRILHYAVMYEQTPVYTPLVSRVSSTTKQDKVTFVGFVNTSIYNPPQRKQNTRIPSPYRLAFSHDPRKHAKHTSENKKNEPTEAKIIMKRPCPR